MSRLAPYLGIIAGLLCGSFIIFFSSRTTVVYIPATVVIPEVVSHVSTTTTSTQTIAPAERAPSKVVSTTIPVPPPSSGRSAALTAAGSALIDALVNIICYAPAGSALHSISASGVFIDPKGIILTNAHVAQYFLLADKGVSCTIRSGTPAADRYTADLIYISPTWLKKNPSVLTETLPNGTGEYDFAFLAVSQSAPRKDSGQATTTMSLPASFPFVPLATVSPFTDTPVVIASYGAQFLEPSQIISTLFPTMVFGSVKDVFTFATNTIDVLSLGGSAIAQEGSSGGGVANVDEELVGIITTSTVSGATDTRSLSAITASYIRSEYASETGKPLNTLLFRSSSFSIANFSQQIPALESIITVNLP